MAGDCLPPGFTSFPLTAMTSLPVIVTHCSIEVDGELPYYDASGYSTVPLNVSAVREPKHIRCKTPAASSAQLDKNRALAAKADEMKARLQAEVDKCLTMGDFCLQVRDDPRQADKESVLQLVSPATYGNLLGRIERTEQARDRAVKTYEAAKARAASIINRKARPQLRRAHALLKAAVRAATVHNKHVAGNYVIVERDEPKKEQSLGKSRKASRKLHAKGGKASAKKGGKVKKGSAVKKGKGRK